MFLYKYIIYASFNFFQTLGIEHPTYSIAEGNNAKSLMCIYPISFPHLFYYKHELLFSCRLAVVERRINN